MSASAALPKLMTVEEFKNHYEWLKTQLIHISSTEYELPLVACNRISTMLDYTVPGGKVNRGLTVVHVAQTLASQPLSLEKEREMAVLGWTIEWMQASFLVSDDIMDSSHTRRGAPCWYLVNNVKTAAINDGLILLTQVEMILERFLGKHANMPEMRRIMLETIYQTELGQLLDLTTQPPGALEVDLSLYTLERYKQIVKYKTAFYSFVAPVALGMQFANVKEKHADVLKAVLLLMGEYFQIQDDVLDCYGDPEVIGKIGTDIEDAKCSWLVVQALSRVNDSQKEVLKRCYGKADPSCVKQIKALFADLNLLKGFETYEEEVTTDIKSKIAKLDNALVQDICTGFLTKIYKRQK